MKTDIKTLLEFAGVDISKGKAKKLVEAYSDSVYLSDEEALKEKMQKNLLVYDDKWASVFYVITDKPAMTEPKFGELMKQDFGEHVFQYFHDDP